MHQESATRRLAAILAVDVAGYSRLMASDERGTHLRLKRHQSELIDPLIKVYRGRIVKSMGDGLIPALTMPKADKGGRNHSLDEWVDTEKEGNMMVKKTGITTILAIAGLE
jgi:class 3 adenylate cyclase